VDGGQACAPLVPGERTLAVHVEDHPLADADVESAIPQGSYGAGTEMWDRGTYELVAEKPDGGLTVPLDGERLQGMSRLVPAPAPIRFALCPALNGLAAARICPRRDRLARPRTAAGRTGANVPHRHR
jgi:DNA polymerase Ligase (LigD)